jgi:hypothetical protein
MKKIFILILSVIFFTGCKKDFLDRSSLTQLAEDNFWLNANDAQLGINGIYDVLQDRVMYSGGLNNGGITGLPCYDGFTDNAFNGYRFEGPGNYVEGNVTPATFIFRDLWASSYRGIVRSNQAIFNIQKMESSKITDATKSFLIAQAHFLRALFYFNLTVYYGEVPLITAPQKLAEASVPKNTQQEILNQVISDLEFAASVLPVTIPAEQLGYATKGAAFGLLARVQLFNKKYVEAAAAAKAVIDLNRYDLSTPFTTIFTEAGENTKEIVFSVRFQEAAGFNTGETFAATFSGQPRVNNQPMPNLVKDYYSTSGLPVNIPATAPSATQKLNRDPRLTATIWFHGDIFVFSAQGVGVAFTATSASNLTRYGQKKYVHTRFSTLGTNPAGAQSQDFYVLRYADILLMRAEALIASDPTNPEIYTLINQVRARVSMPTIQAVEGSNLNQIQLTDILRHERRVELAFEGLRFFDLIRWGGVSDAYTRMKNDAIVSYNPNFRGLMSQTFPIPLNELDANKKLTQSDPWK